MKKTRTALLFVTTVLAGCSGQTKGPEQQWTKTISGFDLIPIYPPQEDILPGDVFLMGLSNPNGKATGDGWPVRIGRSPASDQLLETVYSQRADLKQGSASAVQTKAPAKKSVAAATPPVAAAVASPPDSADDAVDSYATLKSKTVPDGPIRMRNLALPQVAWQTYTTAQLAGGGETSGLNIFGGLGGSESKAVSISATHLKELHIDEAGLWSEIDRHGTKFIAESFTLEQLVNRLRAKKPNDLTLVHALCTTDFATLDKAGIYLLASNEVVYAHDIDYSYTDDSTFAGSIAAAVAAPGSSGPSTASTPTGGAASSNPEGTTGGDTTKLTPSTPAQRVSDMLTKLNTSAAAYRNSGGAQLSYGIGRSGALTLKTHYNHPLAIGITGSARFSIGDVMWHYKLIMQGQNVSEVDKGDLSVAQHWIENAGALCSHYGQDGTALNNLLNSRAGSPN